MDRERLTDLLHDPAQATTGELAALQTMATQFPWFSGAQLLLAVGRHASDDVLVTGTPGNPAAFLPSRAVLFDMLQREEQVPTAVVPAPLTVVEASPSPLQPTVAPAAPTDEATVTEPAKGPIAPHTDVEFAALTSPAPMVPVEQETTPDVPVPIAEPASARPEADILEQQIQEAIRASGYQIGQFAVGIPVEIEPIAGDPAPPEPEVAPTPVIPEPMAATPPPQLVPATARLKFTDWLDQQGTLPDISQAVAEQAPVQLQYSAPTAPLAPTETLPAPSAAEIMEKFIRRGEAEVKPKATFFNPQQAAKKSLEDHGLVSETLAQILEKQGNFNKAREVYDRLALKHPEKSVYFAALSKALEGRSNK